MNITWDSLELPAENYLKCAMDIYSILLKRDLTQNVKDPVHGNYSDVTYSRHDKKILSLLLAGFLPSVDMSESILECDEFTLENILEFSEISLEEIDPMTEEEYEKFYNDNFKRVINQIIDELSGYYEIYNITPEVIFYSLHSRYDTNSNVVDHVFSKYSNDNFSTTLSSHSIFKTVEAVANEHGDFSHKYKNKKSNSSGNLFQSETNHLSSLSSPLPFLPPFSFGSTLEDGEDKEDKKEDKTGKEFTLGPDVWKHIDVLRGKFIGQEEFAEDIFYNIVNNLELAKHDNIPSGERSIIFVDGPSGTGKTAITTDIAKALGVPYVCTSITNFSSTGYVGGSLTDILEQLVEKCKGDIKLAQKGIVIIDEFDKIATDSDYDLRMKKAVQDELLGLLGGETYNISLGRMPLIGDIKTEFDTSKLTFVCLGAITNLRDQKTSNKQPIGFAAPTKTTTEEYCIKPDDLIKMGLQKELVGRINTFLHTNDYDIVALEKILRESEISPLIGFTKWAEHYGKKVDVDEEVYHLMAEKAYDFNTGARSLQTIMDSIRTRYIRQVLRGEEKSIHLSSDDVRAAYAKTVNRSMRG